MELGTWRRVITVLRCRPRYMRFPKPKCQCLFQCFPGNRHLLRIPPVVVNELLFPTDSIQRLKAEFALEKESGRHIKLYIRELWDCLLHEVYLAPHSQEMRDAVGDHVGHSQQVDDGEGQRRSQSHRWVQESQSAEDHYCHLREK